MSKESEPSSSSVIQKQNDDYSFLVAEMHVHTEDIVVPIIKAVCDNINMAATILVGINLIQLSQAIEHLSNGIEASFTQNMSIIKIQKENVFDIFNSEHITVTEDLIPSKELLAKLFETNNKYELEREKYFNTRLKVAKNSNVNSPLHVDPTIYESDRKRKEDENIARNNIKPISKVQRPR